MWRKPGENKIKEEECQEPSTAPIGLLELVIHREWKKIVFQLFFIAVQVCLKSRLLSSCIWSGVCPLWRSRETDPYGHVRGHYTGDLLFKLGLIHFCLKADHARNYAFPYLILTCALCTCRALP